MPDFKVILSVFVFPVRPSKTLIMLDYVFNITLRRMKGVETERQLHGKSVLDLIPSHEVILHPRKALVSRVTYRE